MDLDTENGKIYKNIQIYHSGGVRGHQLGDIVKLIILTLEITPPTSNPPSHVTPLSPHLGLDETQLAF